MELPSDMNGIAKTPATGQLFNINPYAKKTTRRKAQLFLHLVAKLLYLCRGTQQEIQTTVAFLCTRVMEPEKDYYQKK